METKFAKDSWLGGIDEHCTVFSFDTEKDWLARRVDLQKEGRHGASDVAAIVGANKYRSPEDVWMERTDRKLPDDLSDNLSVLMGKNAEPLIADRWAGKYPDCKVYDPGEFTIITNPSYPQLFCTPDRFVQDAPGSWGCLEMKFTVARKGWKDNEAPPMHIIQLKIQMAVCGVSWGSLAAIIHSYPPEFVARYFEADPDAVSQMAMEIDGFNTMVRDDRRPQ